MTRIPAVTMMTPVTEIIDGTSPSAGIAISSDSAGAPDMSGARNRLSPPKDHHLPANAWGDSHALSAAFAPLSGGRANGEEGVIEALRSSLREMEAELGPDDANVLEIRKMLREYEEAQRR